MSISYFKIKAVQFQVGGCLIYLLLMLFAMVFYTGGTRVDASNPGYSFWQNYLSDSGRTIAYSGIPNTISMIILPIALIIYALSYLPLYLKMSVFFYEDKFGKYFIRVGTCMGIFASIFLIGIALTPEDILSIPHVFFVYIGYIFILINAILYSIALFLNNKFSNIYAINLAIFATIFFMTLMMGVFGGLSVSVIGQKIGRFATMATFIIIAHGIWKLEKHHSFQKEIIED